MDFANKSYSELIQLRAAIEEQIAIQETAVIEKLNQGEQVPGFRFKEGRMSRKITNEGLLVQTLRDKGIANSDMYEAKLLGVPALEKLVKAKLTQADADKLIKRHIDVTYGNPKLEYTGE
jgi:hypothetical protein